MRVMALGQREEQAYRSLCQTTLRPQAAHLLYVTRSLYLSRVRYVDRLAYLSQPLHLSCQVPQQASRLRSHRSHTGSLELKCFWD